MSGRLQQLLADASSERATIVPSCYDALSARVAEAAGFEAVGVSGYDLGATLGITEPLITLPELVATCTNIRRSVDVAIMADAGAGFGEPMHCARAVADLRRAGVDAVHIEDQIYPKRAHYFKDYTEHLVSPEEFYAKLSYAKQAAGDMAIVARTDAFKTHGEEEAVRRGNRALEAGADAVMAFPNDLEEARRFPAQIDGPVMYVNTHGNRVGRPMLGAAQAAEFGYAMLTQAHSLLFAAVFAMDQLMQTEPEADPVRGGLDSIAIRKRVEELLDVRGLLEIEAATVETG